jgi:hypothetical protein
MPINKRHSHGKNREVIIADPKGLADCCDDRLAMNALKKAPSIMMML